MVVDKKVKFYFTQRSQCVAEVPSVEATGVRRGTERRLRG